MSVILHLSDLHLAPGKQHPSLGAHPTPVVSEEERLTATGFWRATIDAVTKAVDKLDAVVISGDLIDKGDADGYAEFAKAMEPLHELGVPPDNILAVPGNHDVPRSQPPGTEGRYRAWADATRGAGYATPLLDGFDIELGGTADAGPLVVDLPDSVIIPVNSSNFCWTLLPARSDADAHRATLERLAAEQRRTSSVLLQEVHDELTAQAKAADEESAALRLQDVARVSHAQMHALRGRLVHLPNDGRLRVVVLHHHLLPVTEREEAKSFESLTNLGLLRQFLREHRIDLVLHGHKHESGLYWDHIYPTGEAGVDAAEWKVLVVAAPGEPGLRRPVARLLEVGGHPRARWVDVRPVLGMAPGQGDVLGSPVRAPVWRGAMAIEQHGAVTIEGGDFDTVYERLLGYISEPRAFPRHHVVCRITSPETHLRLPKAYPDVGKPERDEWFESLVRLWNSRDSRLLPVLAFNHGQRIYDWWEHQFDRAMTALQSDEQTTRAVVVLVDPRSETGSTTLTFPSFVLVQFLLVRRRGGVELDCIGFFRKQEMKFWWPVNVGELSTLQRKMLVGLGDRGLEYQAGHLVTVSAYAEVGGALPEVAVPDIDRTVDDDPGRLLHMALAIAAPWLVDRELARRQWREALEELRPDPEGPGARAKRSRMGLLEIHAHLEHLRAAGLDRASARTVEARLSRVVELYKVVRDGRPRAERQVVADAIVDLEAVVRRAICEPRRTLRRPFAGEYPD